MRFFPAFLTVTLTAAMLAGCGVSPSPLAAQRAAQAAAAKAKGGSFPAAATTKEAFVAAAAAKGIKLTAENLAVLQAERVVKPTGIWAPRPAEKLTAEQNLDIHFKKHGHEFKPALTSAQGYMDQGNAAGMGGRGEVRFFFDTTSFQKGYQSHIVRWVPKTHDFTAFRADGAETTYYQNDPSPSRFIEIPTW